LFIVILSLYFILWPYVLKAIYEGTFDDLWKDQLLKMNICQNVNCSSQHRTFNNGICPSGIFTIFQLQLQYSSFQIVMHSVIDRLILYIMIVFSLGLCILTAKQVHNLYFKVCGSKSTVSVKIVFIVLPSCY